MFRNIDGQNVKTWHSLVIDADQHNGQFSLNKIIDTEGEKFTIFALLNLAYTSIEEKAILVLLEKIED